MSYTLNLTFLLFEISRQMRAHGTDVHGIYLRQHLCHFPTDLTNPSEKSHGQREKERPIRMYVHAPNTHYLSPSVILLHCLTHEEFNYT